MAAWTNSALTTRRAMTRLKGDGDEGYLGSMYVRTNSQRFRPSEAVLRASADAGDGLGAGIIGRDAATIQRSVIAATALALLCAAFSALAWQPAQADAAIYTHCNSTSWPALTLCPSQPNGDRHTYKSGRSATAAPAPYQIGVAWYVAYTSSNASTEKYYFSGPGGTTLYSSMPNNTELLRGYTFHTFQTALYGEGSY